jgi:hypothetical protein
MKDRVDKSMGIVILIPETLATIKPTEPTRFAKRFFSFQKPFFSSLLRYRLFVLCVLFA